MFLPTLPYGPLPTAIEIGLVRALAALPPPSHGALLSGGLHISIGSPQCAEQFERIVGKSTPPIAGASILWTGGADIYFSAAYETHLTEMPGRCLTNSLSASPLKFRFIELYRVMESLYIAEIKSKLIERFSADPGSALAEAQDLIKSELKQIQALAEREKEVFDQCWMEFEKMNNVNRFVSALLRKLKDIKKMNGFTANWQLGAATIYLMSCAIAHSGQKDLIFESFPDGNEVVDAVIEKVERAALRLVGIEVV